MQSSTDSQFKYKSDNKQLAKNTGVLYLRMIITVGISFYTTRIILANLGIEDYGLYNVIGGFVSMFFMITTSLSTAESRYISFEIGHGDKTKLNAIFYTSVNIQCILSFVIFVLGETIGLWFVNTQLTINSDRIVAANYLYQFSLVSFLIEMMAVPYGACVISHEKMTLYALATIIKVVLNMLIALYLAYTSFDKLIIYGFLMMMISFIHIIIYYVYCRRKFEECSYQFNIDKTLTKEMFGFAGWSFLGGVSEMLRSQGINILLNIFFGSSINAARGVVAQVEGSAKAFSINFITALTPQIAKNYATGNKNEACKQTYEGCKFSFLLLFVIGLPIIFEAPIILSIWLKELPTLVVPFLRLTIIYSFIDIMVRPIRFLNNATGNIRNYQLLQSIGQFSVLPICYTFLKLGFSPIITLYISIIVESILLLPRVWLNRKKAGMSVKVFSRKVLLPITYVIIPTIGIMFLLVNNLPKSFLRLCISLVVSTFVIIVTSYNFALTASEKAMLKSFVRNRILKQK